MPNRKQRIGIVVSDKMNKTRVVVYEFLKQHPLYKKYIRRRKKFMFTMKTMSLELEI